MRAVNLLPRDSEVARGGSARLPILIVAGVVAALTVLFAMTTMQASSKASQSRGDLELAQAALAALPEADDEEPAGPELVTERSDRLAALRTALGTRMPVDRFFHDLSYVVPEDVWLTGLNVTIASETAQSTPASATSTPSAVTIDGATYTQAAIARFVSRLGALGSLANAHLTESTRVEPQALTPTGSASTKAKTKHAKRQRAVITFKVEADFVEGTSS